MTMKKIFLLLFIALLGNAAIAQITDYSIFDKKFNFYVANDLGRNGYYDQKPIAELMGQMAEEVGPEFVLATGDVHHFEGVRSVNDPLWMTNYELIYSHPELMIDWFPLLGNHEYRGNTQAVLDYSNISRRWTMPARYYTKTFEDNGATIRILWVDTAPMIDKYRNESETYPDACKQDYQQQLSWIDSVLTAAKEDWVIVAGHHPIYAETPKDESERADMQSRSHPAQAQGGYVHLRAHPQLPARTRGRQRHRLYHQFCRFARPQGEAHRRDRILQPRTGFLHCIGQQKDTGTAHD